MENNAKPNTTKKPTTKKVVGSVVKKKPIKKPGQKQTRSTRKMTDAVFKGICIELSFNDIGLKRLCEKHNTSSSAFFDLLKDNKELTDFYMRARDMQADFLADQIIEIADDSSKDTIKFMKDGQQQEMENKEWVNRSKLRVEARKWIASKLKPKKYGDKLEVDQKTELSGTVEVKQITGMRVISTEQTEAKEEEK
jgi:hypothetical protein